jgi:hypothetical protein
MKRPVLYTFRATDDALVRFITTYCTGNYLRKSYSKILLLIHTAIIGEVAQFFCLDTYI